MVSMNLNGKRKNKEWRKKKNTDLEHNEGDGKNEDKDGEEGHAGGRTVFLGKKKK